MSPGPITSQRAQAAATGESGGGAASEVVGPIGVGKRSESREGCRLRGRPRGASFLSASARHDDGAPPIAAAGSAPWRAWLAQRAYVVRQPRTNIPTQAQEANDVRAA